MIYTQLIKPYTIIMAVGCYHGINSLWLLRALPGLHWDARVIPLQLRVESHARLAILGIKSQSYGIFNDLQYLFFIVSWFRFYYQECRLVAMVDG